MLKTKRNASQQLIELLKKAPTKITAPHFCYIYIFSISAKIHKEIKCKTHSTVPYLIIYWSGTGK